MPEPKFTPGPWVAIPTSMRWRGNAPVFNDGLWHILPANDTERLPICEVDHADDHHEPCRLRAANDAHLIAAAPELYAALVSLREAVKAEPSMNHQRFDALGIQVNAALAKARGESNG